MSAPGVGSPAGSAAWARIASEWPARPRRFLVTGAAGFIGGHLVERLLELGQRVVGLDDFSTGRRSNLDDVRESVGERVFDERFELVEGDVRDPSACARAVDGADAVLHQAALGSVPRSLRDPRSTHEVNVGGFLELLEACRAAGVRRFVYASSSSVYGDHPDLPKRERAVGRPLSPYAASKAIDEVLAGAWARSFGIEAIGLRYFNVFGPRQRPDGPYAAVVPRWIEAFLAGEVPVVYGDGETSRDFCPVWNAVLANLLAAEADERAFGEAFNVALGRRTSLNRLFELLRDGLRRRGVAGLAEAPCREAFRPGDVRHSEADLSRAEGLLGYRPPVGFEEGIERTLDRRLRTRLARGAAVGEGGAAGCASTS